jgi:glycosyltransferase involved in cell wall biosynthesis
MAHTGVCNLAAEKLQLMKRICIYSYNIRALFSDKTEQGAGGAEFQLLTLAKMLKGAGYKIIFLVGDFDQPDYEVIDGFTFVKCFSGKNKSPVIKFLYLFNALIKTKADVFIERGSSSMTFRLSLFSKILKKKFIFCGASDINFASDANDPGIIGKTARRLYNTGLKLAASIIVQKNTQKELLLKYFNRNGIVIPNFAVKCNPSVTEKKYNILWVSNIIPYKNPEILLEIAKSLPDFSFIIVGGARDKSYFNKIKEEAGKLNNLKFMGFVPSQEVIKFISKSEILVNTTIVDGRYEEGFPNSFLQAWQMGVPVVSLISNPDNILNTYNIGICSGTKEKMISDISSLISNDEKRLEMGRNAIKYVKERHNDANIFNKYVEIIEQ